ncbi:MAG: ribonuclease E/G [Candidatus Parvarchaeota archaeon]|nr:ribonuclease E/G [Candidatus Parvarchaeota archaeon]
MKVKVRGIYSTAITKLLLDANIGITQATDALKKVMDINDESEPDVMIEDVETKEGIYVYGDNPSGVISSIKDNLKNSIFSREDIGRIYCGVIKEADQKSKSIIISLPENEEGVLDMKSFWGYVKPGSKILVQSKGTYDGKIMLSTQLRLFGEHVIIIKNGFTKMSRGIRSHEGRDKLYEIAKSMDLKDWGVLWVHGAESADETILKDELSSLMQKEKEISEKFENCSEPTILYVGVEKYFVMFGKDDKYKLDEIRKGVMMTIPKHHSLKSAGYTILTDFAEDILDSAPEDLVSKKISETLLRYGPLKDRMYRLSFTRLNGTSYKVDGMLNDFTVKDGEVKSITLTSRSSWGDKTYFLDADKDIVTVKHSEYEEKILVVKPEIFPKFAKITTFDVVSKIENGTVTVSNEDRIDRLAQKGAISAELESRLKKDISEMKSI